MADVSQAGGGLHFSSRRVCEDEEVMMMMTLIGEVTTTTQQSALRQGGGVVGSGDNNDNGWHGAAAANGLQPDNVGRRIRSQGILGSRQGEHDVLLPTADPRTMILWGLIVAQPV